MSDGTPKDSSPRFPSSTSSSSPTPSRPPVPPVPDRKESLPAPSTCGGAEPSDTLHTLSVTTQDSASASTRSSASSSTSSICGGAVGGVSASGSSSRGTPSPVPTSSAAKRSPSPRGGSRGAQNSDDQRSVRHKISSVQSGASGTSLSDAPETKSSDTATTEVEAAPTLKFLTDPSTVTTCSPGETKRTSRHQRRERSKERKTKAVSLFYIDDSDDDEFDRDLDSASFRNSVDVSSLLGAVGGTGESGPPASPQGDQDFRPALKKRYDSRDVPPSTLISRRSTTSSNVVVGVEPVVRPKTSVVGESSSYPNSPARTSQHQQQQQQRRESEVVPSLCGDIVPGINVLPGKHRIRRARRSQAAHSSSSSSSNSNSSAHHPHPNTSSHSSTGSSRRQGDNTAAGEMSAPGVAAGGSGGGMPPSSQREFGVSAPTAAIAPTVSRTPSYTDGVIDDPHATYTYEAQCLYRESFQILYEFFQSNVLCDVEIVCGERAVKCHRAVIACCSRYFRTMFTSEMAESTASSVTIKDIDADALSKLIEFAYTAKITLTIDNVQTLLYASSILQVESVAHACCEFMKTHLHPTNCIGIRNFAELHGRDELITRADQFTRDHFLGVVDNEEFFAMSVSHLEKLLNSQDLNVSSEQQVYEALIKWVKYDQDARHQHLPVLLSHVKLALLPPTYLLETIGNEDLLRTSLECRDFLDEAKHYQLSKAHVVPDIKLSEKLLPRKSYAGVVFCVGGRGASGSPFKSIECYEFRQDRWFHISEMSTRRRHVGVVSVSGKLYAIGGHDGTEHLNSGEVFSPATNKWKPIAPMATQRRGIALACLGGPIYAIGGLDDSTCFNIVERYDPDSDSWSFVQAMNFPRGGVAVAALKGHLYAIGGNDGSASLDSCERYDPHLNKWTLIAAMQKRRAGAGVAELGGRLYVIGGFDDNSPLDSVEVYNPRADQWNMVDHMSCPRGGVGVAPLAGSILAVGGHDGSNYLKTVESYNPFTDQWHSAASISTSRAGAGIAVIACQITDLQDAAKVNMSATVRGIRRQGSQQQKRTSCIVTCSIVAHTSIVYPVDPPPESARPDQSPRASATNLPPSNITGHLTTASLQTGTSPGPMPSRGLNRNLAADTSAASRHTNLMSPSATSTISSDSTISGSLSNTSTPTHAAHSSKTS